MKKEYVATFQVIFLLFSSIIFADITHPQFESNYDGEIKNILAINESVKFSERDLYLSLLIKKYSPAYIYEQYLKEKNPDEQANLKKIIKNTISELMSIGQLIKYPDVDKNLSDTDYLKIRFNMYPVYQYLWITKYLKDQTKPKVIVLPEDIKKYYNENLNSEFLIPEKIHIRYIRISPEKEIEKERQKIKSLLEDAKINSKNEADFAEYAKKLSEAENSQEGGVLQPFARGTYPKDFEELAFSLLPNQISAVTELSDGFYLIYCIKRINETIKPLSEVQEQIKNKLFLKFLKIQYETEQKKLTQKLVPKNDYLNWNYLDDTDTVIKVKRFKLTKKQIKSLFSSVITKDGMVDTQTLSGICTDIINNESIISDLQKKRLLNDDFFFTAETMAKNIYITDRYIDSLSSKQENLNKNEIRDNLLKEVLKEYPINFLFESVQR